METLEECPSEIVIEKRCRRCGEFKDMALHFRVGNHVCRLCRNAMVKQWTSANGLRREIIRTKARRSAYIQRLSKRQKIQDNTNVEESVVPAMEHSAERGDEQVASV
jgi:hypothetical protein